MDNIGDWLYIVMIVGAGIFSWLTSGKKKKEEEEAKKQRPQSQPQHHTPKMEDNSWDTFWDKEESPLPSPPQKPKQRIEISSPKQSYRSPARSSIGKQDRISDNMMREETILLEEDNSSPLVSNEDFNETEQLRKAILYSEILNRKY